MSLLALRFGGAAPGERPLRMDLDAGSSGVSDTLKSCVRPSVLVVRNSDLGRLRALTDQITDRGRKHPAKGLSEYLLHCDRIPLVEGTYRSAGRLRQGLQDFLEAARGQGERNLYFVGADDSVFEELWKEARLEAPPPRAEAPRAECLEDLLAELPVPPELEERFVGMTPQHKLVRQLILRAAKVDAPVLLLGDVGCGKSLVARLIHDQSPRRQENFVEVNCGAIPSELLESELFGCMKGAYTGAVADRAGLWELAGRGTLFLDEIGDLQLHHQVKILHALQNRRIVRVGGRREIDVPARVIAATNRDLNSMVRRGEFSRALHSRLFYLPIKVPRLRTDLANFVLIVQDAWRKITREPAHPLPEPLVGELYQCDWPAGMRDLKATLTHFQSLFGADGLCVEHLRALLQYRGQAAVPEQSPADAGDVTQFPLECLRHLRHADRVVHDCELTLRPIKEEGIKPDRAALRSLRESLDYRLQDLDQLCEERLLFHDEAVYRAVDALREKLGSFQRRLENGGEGLWRYWSIDLAPQFQRAVTLIFDEVRKVMAEFRQPAGDHSLNSAAATK